MSAPVDFGPMGRLIESTRQVLELARGGRPEADDDPMPVAGHGEAADGQIRVEAQPGGRLANLELDPRVMRLDSVTLAAAILTAANAALADLQSQVRASLAGPDLAVLADQLTQVQQESTQQMSAFLTALTEAQGRIAAAGRPS